MNQNQRSRLSCRTSQLSGWRGDDFPPAANDRTYRSTCQASSSVKMSGTKEAIAVPLLPFFRIQNSSPSVRATCHSLSVKFLGKGPFSVPGSMSPPNPLPSFPWQVTQKAFPWKSLFPFSTVSYVAGSGLAQVLASSIWSMGTCGLSTASLVPKTGMLGKPAAATMTMISRYGLIAIPISYEDSQSTETSPVH